MVAHDLLRIYRDEAPRCATVLREAGLDAAAQLCAARADAFKLAMKEIESDWADGAPADDDDDDEDDEDDEDEDDEEEEEAGDEEEAEAPVARRRGPRREAPTPLWSAERVELLRRLWPRADVSNETILEQINALPGEPIADDVALRSKVKRLANAPRRPHWTRLPGGNQLRAGLGEAAREAVKARSERYHSPERDALIRSLWGDNAVTVPEIARRVAKLPPGAVPSPTWVWRRAVDLGLPSSRFGAPARGEKAATEAAA